MQTDLRKKIDNNAAIKIVAFGKQEDGQINFDESNNILISNYDIEKEFRLDSPCNNSLGQPRIFKNCIFVNEVFVNYAECRISVYFSNCIFKSDVEIINTLGNEGSIFRDGCIFQTDLSITAKNTSSNYKFDDFSVYNNLYFKGCYGNFLLSNINNKGNSPSSNLIIDSSEKYTFKKLQIENSNFNCIKLFCGIAYEGLIKNIKAHQLDLNNLYIGLNFILETIIIENLLLDNIQGEVDKGKRFFELKNQCFFKEAHMVLSMIEKMDINHCQFNKLSLTGTLQNKAIFNIESSEISNLKFSEVLNDGLITVRNLKKNKTISLEILSSNMGKTEFFNCDFSETLLYFHDSRVTDIFPISTDFPNKVTNDNYDQCRLFFSQLHTVFTKQGDTIRALEYQSIEVETHYNKLEFWSKQWPTVFALWLNKISNSFGRNWFQGVCFTIGVGLLFFYALVISTDEYSIDIAFDSDWKFVPAFIRFMNPLRFFELENLFKISNNDSFLTLSYYSYIWDSLGRIFVAYGVYQTIQAFRKYGRK